MNHPFRTSPRPWRLAALILLPVLLAACMPQQSNSVVITGSVPDEVSQPQHATYQCEDGSTLAVENLRTYVRVAGSDGEIIELPASPADQESRYGEALHALVLDGRAALYMKNGSEPLDCQR